MKKVKIDIGWKKYVVYIDTEDINKINKIAKKIKRHFAWYKFWNRVIIVPKGAVEIVKI